MNAFSPAYTNDLPLAETYRSSGFVVRGSAKRGLLARLYDGLIAGLRPEPDLGDMGPSQIQELLVMRGRD